MSLPSRRTFETLGMMMIGDGVLAVLEPRRHVALWRSGPAGLRKAMGYFERRPLLTAGVGVVEVALGVWLARSQSQGIRPLPEAEG